MRLNVNIKGIGKKIAKVPRIYKLVFILLVNVLIFGLLYYFMITPQLETKNKLAGEYEEVKKTLDKMVAIRNNMAKYRAEYEQMQQMLSQVLQQLPDTKDIPNLLRNVSNLGTETMVKVRYFEAKAVQSREFYAELPFDIRYSGPFHNIAYFFDGIRRLDRIINISTFTLELPARGDPARPVLEGQCSARTYVYLKERPQAKKEVKKEGKGAAPAKK
jgi:type IV pilus assembly protein PilO